MGAGAATWKQEGVPQLPARQRQLPVLDAVQRLQQRLLPRSLIPISKGHESGELSAFLQMQQHLVPLQAISRRILLG